MADPPARSPRASLSVVVPAYNAGTTLVACIEALLASDAPLAEIILADDGSTDGSPESAAALDPCVSVLRVGDAPQGPAAARNAAVRVARGELVAFIDADVCVHVDALRHLTAPIETEPGVVASFGGYDHAPTDRRASSLYANLRHHRVHQQAPAEGTTFWSGIGAVRRDAFLDAGGFDPSFEKPSIEDVELGARLRSLGGRIRVVREAQGTHLKSWPVAKLWRTDIAARALPWAELAVEHPELSSSLNAGAKEKLAALCVAGVVGLLAALPVLGPAVGWVVPIGAVAACVLLWAAINRGLLALLVRRGGPRALLIGAALHAVYYLYSGGAYVLGGSWFRWRAVLLRDAWCAALAWLTLGLVLLCGATVCAVLGFVETAWLLDQVVRYERTPENPRYTADTLAVVQSRLRLITPVMLACAGIAVLRGPVWLERELAGLSSLVREAFAWRRDHAAVVVGLTLAFAIVAALHLDQPMRNDESSSFVMFAETSPLVALFTYEVPNNHVLHSFLMWVSVRMFGVEEWAVRLPAYAVTLLIPAMTYAAGRSLMDARVGLVAAGLAAGGAFAIELATNARGYPIVAVCMLGLLTVAPSLAAGAAGAGLVVILLGVTGLYAVPLMGYALSIVYLAALAMAPLARIGVTAHVRRFCVTGAATCAAAATLYLPAWALNSSRGPVGVIGYTDDGSTSKGPIDAGLIVYNTRAALVQWTQPLPESLVWIGAIAIVGGLISLLVEGRRGRSLVAGLLIGPAVVFTLTGFRVPPWWALAWCYPLVALLMGALVARMLPHSAWGVAAVPVLAAGAIGATVASGYPKDFPYWGGYPDALLAAQTIDALAKGEEHIVSHGGMRRSIEYQRRKLGILGRPIELTPNIRKPMLPRLLHVRADPVEHSGYNDSIPPEALERLDFVTTHTFGTSTIDEYRLRTVDPAQPNGDEP